MKKNIVCMTGPSGVGKTSYARRLANEYGYRLASVVTTRAKRLDDSIEMRYVSIPEFRSLIQTDSFLEFDIYSGNYYGTLLSDVESVLDNPNSPGVVLDLTPIGCVLTQKKFPTAVTIGLVPDDASWLKKRLLERNTQSPSEIKKRCDELETYLSHVKSIASHIVYVSYSPTTWERSFNEIISIVRR